MGRFLQSRYQYDGAWRSSLTQDFMDLLKRPVGTIYFILYSKLELPLFTMSGNSGQRSCGISYQTKLSCLGLWESLCFPPPPLAVFPSCWRMCSPSFWPHSGLSWNSLFVSEHFLVRVCAVAHVSVTWAFGTCWLRRAPLQVPSAKSIYEPKESKLPLSFLGVSNPHPPRRLVLLAQRWHNEGLLLHILPRKSNLLSRTLSRKLGTKTDSS